MTLIKTHLRQKLIHQVDVIRNCSGLEPHFHKSIVIIVWGELLLKITRRGHHEIMKRNNENDDNDVYYFSEGKIRP